MSKSVIFSLIATVLVSASVSQSIANENVPAGASTQSLTTSNDPSSATGASNATDAGSAKGAASSSDPSNTGKSRLSSKHSNFAKKFLGVVTGLVVGTPVCAIRKPIDEDKYAIADLTGNSKKARAVVPTAVLWAPFAGVAGLLEAPFYALNNSLVNSDKPFSKEQFSLVNPGASIKKEEELPVSRPGDVR